MSSRRLVNFKARSWRAPTLSFVAGILAVSCSTASRPSTPAPIAIEAKPIAFTDVERPGAAKVFAGAARVVRVLLENTDDGKLLDRRIWMDQSPFTAVGPFVSAVAPVNGTKRGRNGSVEASHSRVPEDPRDPHWYELEFNPNRSTWIGIAFGGCTLGSVRAPENADEVTLAFSVKSMDRLVGALDVSVRDQTNHGALGHIGVFLRLDHGEEKYARSDDSGVAHFTSIIPEEVELHFEDDHQRFVQRNGRVFVAPGGTTQFSVELETAVRIAGVLRDSSGTPTAGDVELRPLGLDPRPMWNWRYVRSSDDGHFTLGGLAHQEYVLLDKQAASRFDSDWRFDRASMPPGTRIVDVSAGSVSDVVLVGTPPNPAPR